MKLNMRELKTLEAIKAWGEYSVWWAPKTQEKLLAAGLIHHTADGKSSKITDAGKALLANGGG